MLGGLPAALDLKLAGPTAHGCRSYTGQRTGFLQCVAFDHTIRLIVLCAVRNDETASVGPRGGDRKSRNYHNQAG